MGGVYTSFVEKKSVVLFKGDVDSAMREKMISLLKTKFKLV